MPEKKIGDKNGEKSGNFWKEALKLRFGISLMGSTILFTKALLL